MSKSALIYPPLLAKGDTIAIAAPASPPEKPRVIDAAIARLKKYGFRIKPGKFLRERDGYLAGSDEERAADINAAFADPEVKGIFCLRGGYGSCRILPQLDYAAIRANPKVFLGYSDITAMHLAILVKSGLITFHGSNASSAFEPANLASCEKMLMGIGPSDVLFQRDRVHRAIKTIVPGRVRGKLIGGNFTCLLRLIGTPWQPDFRGAILFLEDTGEKAYRIDGMFTHLRLAGLLEQLGGLVLGQFDYDSDRREQARIAEVLPREAKRLGVPCVTGAPIGHFPAQIIVPQGVDAELDADAGRLSFRAP
ncbi:MAG TPA: LD-carboxypeptidase [Candidatus Methylacidiphilales bacterium]|nr:LD-carboxypeptidase [Candidatus Methylacidiphilales bacterium]